MMDAETWLSAKDALKLGFADVIDEEKQIAASVQGKYILMNGLKLDIAKYNNPPNIKELKQMIATEDMKEEKEASTEEKETTAEAKEEKKLGKELVKENNESEEKKIQETAGQQLEQLNNEELFLYEKSMQLKLKKYGR
jgi:ATP-dependent Clp protease protease subunit